MLFVRVEAKKQRQLIKIDDIKKVTCLNLAVKGRNAMLIERKFLS